MSAGRGQAPLIVDVADTLAGIEPQAWNRLAGEDPFLRHEFLAALHETGCAAPKAGWTPQYLLLREHGRLAAAMPLYVKTHSYGEYVFDWAWADAHERNGIDYYPKLVCAIPFTPVRGARILAGTSAAKKILVQAALELARDTSSLHILFARLIRRPESPVLWFFGVVTGPLTRPVRAVLPTGTPEGRVRAVSFLTYLVLWLAVRAAFVSMGLPRPG